MKRTQVFTLIMAIFWTVIAIAAIIVVPRSGMGEAMNMLIIALALVAVVGNWLRWFRSR